MAEYKRFVSYIYNYEKKEKKNNVGYARVENKGTRCKITIHVQIKSISAGTIKVYGFIRKEKNLRGILLGDISLRNGGGDCQITTLVNAVADSGYQFTDLGGIILYISDDKFFGSEWDDRPIVFDRFEIGSKEDFQEEKILLKTAELKEEEIRVKAEEIREKEENISKAEDEISVTEETGTLIDETQEFKNKMERLDVGDTPTFTTYSLKEIYDKLGYQVKNDFVIHGYRRFGHLGVMEQNGRSIIGIPGVYCKREQEVAKNYGFENFLPRIPKKLQYGDFGYWYLTTANSD